MYDFDIEEDPLTDVRIRMYRSCNRKLKRLALEEGISVRQIIYRAITAYDKSLNRKRRLRTTSSNGERDVTFIRRIPKGQRAA